MFQIFSILGTALYAEIGFAADSATLRQQTHYETALQLGVLSEGILLGVNISDSKTLVLEGGMDILQWSQYVKVGARTFWGNSFYTTQSAVAFSGFESKEVGLGVDLNLGNEWQWESGLTAGCDWFGMMARLNEYYVRPDDAADATSQASEARKGALGDAKLWENIKPYVLRFRIGYAF
jgi:hypothetical protein